MVDEGEEEEEMVEPRLEVGGEALPLELTIHVLSFLDARDRLSLSLVSRPFRALADDDLQWRRLYAREWFKEGSEAPNGQTWERRSLPKVKGLVSWKQLFRIRTQTERAHFAGGTARHRPRHQHQHLADAAAFHFGYDQPHQGEDGDDHDHDHGHDHGLDLDLDDGDDVAAPVPLPPLFPPHATLGLDDPILALLGAVARAAAGGQADVGGDAPGGVADAVGGGDDDDDGGGGGGGGGGDEESPKDSWVCREKRDGRTYCDWGECLRQELPKVTTDEDDPVQLKEDRDTMEMRSLYLICREEYLSALSFGLTPQNQFEVYFALGDVTHEFSIYQRHFPHKPAHLREWYELACEAFEKSISKVKLSLGDKSSTLCAWAGVIRDYANSGVGGNEQTDRLFRLAYDKYQEALDLYARRRPDYLLIENWAYAVREHANFNVRVGNLSEAKRRFDECFEKYEQCNSLYSDSIVLSNWADALREKAEIVDGDEREQLFKQAHHKYKLSFGLDGMDCLTLCNWAMLYCLRARTRHARAQSLREDTSRCRDTLLRTEQDGQATQTRAELEAELSAKEIQAAEAEADYRRLVAVGKAKLEHGIAQEDLWTYFCMARLCSAAGEAEECREWMTKCAAKRYLSKAKDSQLADFAFVRDLPWFKDMQQEASPPADPLEVAEQ